MQIQLVIEALQPGVVALIRDLNGNHVIQRCLQRLGPEESQFVYDAALRNTMEIATHRHGCCVLQRCIDFATAAQKSGLVNRVVANAYTLSQVRLPNLTSEQLRLFQISCPFIPLLTHLFAPLVFTSAVPKLTGQLGS